MKMNENVSKFFRLVCLIHSLSYEHNRTLYFTFLVPVVLLLFIGLKFFFKFRITMLKSFIYIEHLHIGKLHASLHGRSLMCDTDVKRFLTHTTVVVQCFYGLY